MNFINIISFDFINFSVKSPGEYEISVNSLIGKNIYSFIGYFATGQHIIEWQIELENKGIYVVAIEGCNRRFIRKIRVLNEQLTMYY